MCTNSLDVHSLKITTNEFSTNGIFCKEHRSLMKKHVHISDNMTKETKKL